jgi:ParB family transcriptional regulator, chromosome partitioning protein
MSPVVREIPLDKLITSPLNVRKDQGDIEGLIASISNMGVLEPIMVLRNGGRYETIAGSLRAEAARRAGQTVIPAIVLEVTDAQAIRISLVENIQRKRLTLRWSPNSGQIAKIGSCS